MNDETIEDIVDEMRGMGNYQSYSRDHVHGLARRIEAAAERMEITRIADIARECAKVKAECESRTRVVEQLYFKAMRALNPVLACDLSNATYADGAVRAVDAVREAQRIMDGDAK